MEPSQLQFLITALAAAMIAVGVGGGALAWARSARSGAKRRARLENPNAPASPGGVAAGALDGVKESVRRLGDRAAIKDPSKVSALRHKLIQAGFYNREAVALFLGARTAALAAAIVAVLVVTPLAMSKGGGMGATALAAMFALAALLGPDQIVRMRRSKMEREYRDGFPDLLDLLVASVQAGLSLDGAVSRITGELGRRYPNLAEHLKLLSLELRAGRPRKEAWSRLADRLGIDESRSFATMLRQAEEMGTSLGDTLTAFSDDMRAKRMLRAEEKALALPAKLVIPLILFIFPCLMGVLLMPAIYQVSQAWPKG
ncbi:MAG TPA: type II secretion system F family protein [Caulobacteraceae bacterium]|jgi:tight adherence protein C